MRKTGFKKLIKITLLSLFLIMFTRLIVIPRLVPILYYVGFDKENRVVANVTPKNYSIPEETVPQSQTTYNYGGLSIKTDWKEEAQVETTYGLMTAFGGDKIIYLYGDEYTNYYNAMVSLSDEDRNYLQENLISNSERNSEFLNLAGVTDNESFFRKLFNTTEKDITILQSNDDIVVNTTFLILKVTRLFNTSEILKYEYGGYTFYQFNPFNDTYGTAGDRTVYSIVFFDDEDNTYGLDIGGPGLTQKDVDTIIKTISIN